LSHIENTGVRGPPTNIWSCCISLVIVYDVHGELLPNPKSIRFGDTISDPREVEKRISAAYNAILYFHTVNKLEDAEYFLAPDYVPPTIEKTVCSGNIVRLDVCGLDSVHLTFIDLPGIIFNSETASNPSFLF